MRKIIALLLLALVSSCHKEYKNLDTAGKTKLALVQDYAQFAQSSKTLDSLAQHSPDIKTVQDAFKKARIRYKKIESFVTFYFPETAKNINGAPIDKNDIEETNRKVEYATGFQKVEELLFAEETDSAELKKQIGILNGFCQSLKANIENIQLSDSNIFEAQKLQMVRMMSLGISGFDSPVALYSLPEAKASIESISNVIALFSEDKEWAALTKKTLDYLDNNPDFNTFNRADFIVGYCIPFSKALNKIQQKLKIKNNRYTNAIDFEKQTVFEEGAFNPDYFAPNYNQKPTGAQIALGEKLFFDPILSGDHTVSCATCHIPDQAYADHKTKAVMASQKSRNTPTLLNSAYQNVQFLDGRVMYLEDQAKMVINNKDEMHGSFANALEKVAKNSAYQAAFRNVFPKEANITEKSLLQSIASYIRSLSGLKSKFDQYLRGKAQLTQNEKDGFNVFMGKAKCATCHFFPLFNGSVPPFYNDTESEVLGVPSQNVTQNAVIDNDLGEYEITRSPLKKHAFKTPTVRNSAITFPYMHNGVYKTLEEVINFYNLGGGAGIGITVDNQTLPGDKLQLSKTEISNLVAFLKTLNNPQKGYNQ
ncbi:cytochrome c peroxidase [Flavobacterium humi]|uniref:Cytochrome-c peroxidase n=1 Tax=Flavobacterium humi TaxID=2562683 RepID=A0A4Z0LC19_9FLAO|nr:cytochrome c peroxidase [Flavobacterium humi]TGD59426.1 cytochrome-c peroxidase [Flavobacterium humi]